MKKLLVGLLALGSISASANILKCEGRAADGTKLKVEVCYLTDGYESKACGDSLDAAAKVYINDNLDYSGYIPNELLVSPELSLVHLTTLNDGRQVHAQIEFELDSDNLGSWNFMRLYSVKTGARYISTNFNCTF